MRICFGLLVSIVVLGTPLHLMAQKGVPQGFGQPLTPAVINLKKDRVQILLKMIPEVAKETAQYQGRFLSSLANSTGKGALPSISEKDLKKLQKIYGKYGFTMEEFIGELSVLVATFLALDDNAFEAMLPHERKPEFNAILSDSSVSETVKDELRLQIRNARKNKGDLRKFLARQTNKANIAILRPLLPKVRHVFKEVEKLSRSSSRAPK